MSGMLGPALRMVVSLGIVLALMYVAARLLNRTRGGSAVRVPRRPALKHPGLASALPKLGHAGGRRNARRRPRLEVIARQPLGKAASVAVVRVADRTLLLGVTDSAVHLLSEMDAAAFDEQTMSGDGATHTDELTAAVGAPIDLVALADSMAKSAETTSELTPEPSARARNVSSVSVLDLLRERTVRRA
jgi:flagellar protein FliO/FliZ